MTNEATSKEKAYAEQLAKKQASARPNCGLCNVKGALVQTCNGAGALGCTLTVTKG